jgi:hypothetical protein
MVKIAVIGTGTVGLMSLSHLLAWLPEDSQVVSIYDPTVPMLGIGETGQPGLVENLFFGTGFTVLNDGHELDATMKLGATWIDWRKDTFDPAIRPPGYSMHFNNFKLKDFCFNRFFEKWKGKFNIIEGNVLGLKNVDAGAAIKVDNNEYLFDFIIDCRGYPEEYTEEYEMVNMHVNHCLGYFDPVPGDWNTTINQAHENGWMFRLPLQTRQNWGYLYNDTITSKDEALDNFSQLMNKDARNLKLGEFTFKHYRAKKILNGRILKNGNRAMFYEPLEASAGFYYDLILRYFMDLLHGNVNENQLNDALYLAAVDTENFLNFVYHGGSTFDSKFWNMARDKSIKALDNQRWQDTIKMVNDSKSEHESVARWHVSHWRMWNKNLNYRYFKD